jgi:tetratricopeptide (TPR) repeat protein
VVKNLTIAMENKNKKSLVKIFLIFLLPYIIAFGISYYFYLLASESANESLNKTLDTFFSGQISIIKQSREINHSQILVLEYLSSMYTGNLDGGEIKSEISKNTGASLQEINKAVREVINGPASDYEKGLAYLVEGNYELALEYFEFFIEENPYNARAYWNAGVAQYNISEYEVKAKDPRVKEYIEKAIDLDPRLKEKDVVHEIFGSTFVVPKTLEE